MDYAGKVAWITGASSGIGAALARELAARGAKVTLGAPRALHGLLRGLTGEIDLVEEGATPEFDLQAPLMSLPHAFGTTLESLPGAARYISAEPARVAKADLRYATGYTFLPANSSVELPKTALAGQRLCIGDHT